MSLRVYNTLTKQKELFEPVKPGKVGVYLCGPTVYKPPHIGHLVGPVIFDAIKRYLVFKGFDVTWVVNITDVDDKLIDAANAEKSTVAAVADRCTKEYLDALAGLGVDTVDKFPKASEHMDEILALTQRLIERKFAYAADGNVWFDVTKDEDYGKLSHRRQEDQEAGNRDLQGSGKVKDEKMSKSLGNVIDAKRAIADLGPDLLRYLILSTHYRSPIDFSDDVVASSRKGLLTFTRLFERVERMLGEPLSAEKNP